MNDRTHWVGCWRDHGECANVLVEELDLALRMAKEMVEFWSAYADPYFREKHALGEDLRRIDTVLARVREDAAWFVRNEMTDKPLTREEENELREAGPSAFTRAEMDRIWATLDAERKAHAATLSELERWRHGVQIEGDYVCPDSLALDAERKAHEEHLQKVDKDWARDIYDLAAQRDAAIREKKTVELVNDALDKKCDAAIRERDEARAQVEHLGGPCDYSKKVEAVWELYHQKQTRIEALEAERAKLVAALRNVLAVESPTYVKDLARAALGGIES